MPKPEAQTIEYKSSWQEDYFEWISGYANAKGGTLYVGVNDDGYVVGVKDTRFLLDTLPNQIGSFLGITVSIDHGSVKKRGENLKYDAVPVDIASKPENLYVRGILTEKAVADINASPDKTSNVTDAVQKLFDAAPGFVKQLRQSEDYRNKVAADLITWKTENPVFLNPDGSLDYVWITVDALPYGVSYHGRYYMRSGGTTRELKDAELSRFLYDKVGKKWDSMTVKRMETDRAAMEYFRKTSAAKKRLSEEQLSVSDATLIKNLKLVTEDGEYTRAAAMLFSNPEDVVFGAYLRIGYFSYEDDRTSFSLSYQDETHGPLVLQADEAVDMIFKKYLKALVDIEGIHRTETYLTSRKILREVILNSIAHKHYPSCQAVQIKVFDDHITVMNMGFWPFNELKVEDAYEGEHSSYQTNPLIAHGLFFAGVMDTWGQGFRLIKSECKRIGAPLPEIKATNDSVTVTIRGSEKYMKLLEKMNGSKNNSNLVTSDGDSDADGDGDSDVVKYGNKTVAEILEFCSMPHSKKEIMEYCEIKSDRYIRQNVLTPLMNNGRLVRTIPDKPNSKNQKYVAVKQEKII